MTIPIPLRMRLVSVLVLLPALVPVPGCVDEEPQRIVFSPGTVVFNTFEGGFYGIVGDDGNLWDPENLPDEFAVDSLRVSFRGVPTDRATFHMWGRTMHLIQVKRLGAPPKVNLEPFRELARTADCADLRNRLFLIDERLVFWDRESKCADATFSRALYGRNVEHLMCRAEDSIAGPRQSCHDRECYATMFRTILSSLDKPDLGLGSAHSVEPVDF